MLPEALQAAEEALKYYEDAGEKKRGMVPVLHTISGIQQALLRHDGAVKSMKQAVRLTQEVDDRAGEATALHSLAYLAMEQLFFELEGTPDVFSASHNLRLEAAWEDLDAALSIVQELKMPDAERRVMETVQWAVDKSRRIHTLITITNHVLPTCVCRIPSLHSFPLPSFLSPPRAPIPLLMFLLVFL